MAVIQYSLVEDLETGALVHPSYFMGVGEWPDQDNGTYIGWKEENPDYYVPSTGWTELTKEQFVERTYAIYKDTNYGALFENEPGTGKTNEELLNALNDWYDSYVKSFATEEE